MAIETTYQSLLGAQRKRRKRQERQDTLLQVGTLATNLYQQNLDKKAQEFFDRSEVADQRIKYQEGYDLFNNKIKKIYDQGTNSVGGLGNYLVDNYATGIAQERIYSNYDEDMVQDPDELGSAIRSYAEEMVYGIKDAEGNRVGDGMLDRLTAAYNSGKTLKNMDKYDEYVSRRADLPENVGMALVGKFFDKKNRQQVEEDALRRVVDNNKFSQDSAAFMTLAQAFDQGMTVRDSEKIAKKVDTYTENLKRKPTEVLKETKEVKRKVPDGRGGSLEWVYFQDVFVNQSTGVTRTVARADDRDPISAAMFNKEAFKVPLEPVERERIDPLSGEKVKDTHTPMYDILNQKEVASVDGEVTARELAPEVRGIFASVGENQETAAEVSINNVLRMDEEGLRDYFDDDSKISYGENEEQAKKYRANINKHTAIIGNNLQAQYGIRDRQTAYMIAAQLQVNNLRYLRDEGEKTLYTGANIAASPEISGLRVIEALNDLEQNTGGRFQMRGFSEAEFNSFLNDLISPKELQYFRGVSSKAETRRLCIQ